MEGHGSEEPKDKTLEQLGKRWTMLVAGPNKGRYFVGLISQPYLRNDHTEGKRSDVRDARYLMIMRPMWTLSCDIKPSVLQHFWYSAT